MKVATKLSAAFCLLVAVLTGLLVYHVRTNRAAVSASYELAEVSSRLSHAGNRQIAALNQLEETAGKYGVTRDEGYLQLFHQAFRDFETGLLAMAAGATTDLERTEVERLRGLWRDFRTPAEAVANPAVDGGLADLGSVFAALRLQTRRAMDASQVAMSARLEASAAASRRAERVSWFVGAGTLLLTVIVFGLLVRSISKGLARLQTGTWQVGLGNFDYRIPTPAGGGDEFAQLAADFNVMTHELGEIDRMKRAFISRVSHDLKTPLASMRETVLVMLEEVPGPITVRQRRLLDLTNQSAERLSSMITKLLDLSAMEAGAMTLDIGGHRAEALIFPAIDALVPGDGSGGDRVLFEAPSSPVWVQCDRDRIIQVMVNLLENALKFSPDEEQVVITVRPVDSVDRLVPSDFRGVVQPAGWESGGVLVEVADRGPGISLSDRRRIFEHFYQAGSGADPGGRGVGLGLAICREIVDLHGGAIWVRENPGGGSVFCVLLESAHHAPPEESRSAWAGADMAVTASS